VVGEIRIGLPSDLGRHHLNGIFDEFLDLYPKMRFDVHLSDYIQDLYRDELDIVIRYCDPKDSSLIASKLCVRAIIAIKHQTVVVKNIRKCLNLLVVAYKSKLDVTQGLASGALVEMLQGQYIGQSTLVYLIYKERKYQPPSLNGIYHVSEEQVYLM
jgi:hypothetical protein